MPVNNRLITACSRINGLFRLIYGIANTKMGAALQVKIEDPADHRTVIEPQLNGIIIECISAGFILFIEFRSGRGYVSVTVFTACEGKLTVVVEEYIFRSGCFFASSHIFIIQAVRCYERSFQLFFFLCRRCPEPVLEPFFGFIG